MEEYKYGDPVPERYRNHLFDWKGGGYSGCFWEMNQGMVDADGHWHPIFSTGDDGIDQNEWYQGRIAEVKKELGYDDSSPAMVQHGDICRQFLRQVFGAEYYLHEGCEPEVRDLMKDENARFAEFIRRRDELRAERTRRLDQMFMDVVDGARSRDRFEDIGGLDDDHLKDTCRVFCASYKDNVGVMTRVLDWLLERGYDPWCTCSDCGEQFRARDFERFAHSMDGNCYRGDNGIGIIMGRVVCDDCHDEVECKVCNDLNLPNPHSKDKGESDWSNYDFLACLMHDWLGVCWSCSNGFELDVLYVWDDAAKERVPTELGRRFVKAQGMLEDRFGLSGRKLYLAAKKTWIGLRMINALRGLLEESASKRFGSYMDDTWFKDRLRREDVRGGKNEGDVEEC